MPKCTYTGTDERYYPSLGVRAVPGLVVDLAELPADGLWQIAPAPKTTPPSGDPAPKK